VFAGPHTGAYAAFWRANFGKALNKQPLTLMLTVVINGEMIELVKADDACEPKQAVSVANRLVDSDGARCGCWSLLFFFIYSGFKNLLKKLVF